MKDFVPPHRLGFYDIDKEVQQGTQYGCVRDIVLGPCSPNGVSIFLAASSVLCWHMNHATTSRTLVAAQRLGRYHLFCEFTDWAYIGATKVS